MTTVESKIDQIYLNDTIEELQFSSGLDVAIIDKEGTVRASKIKYSKTEKIGTLILESLEKNKKIAEALQTGEIEEFILHGKNGYTLIKVSNSHILVVSGLKEHQLGLALFKLRQIVENFEYNQL
ncbi:MAG: roadblock/LC7 domain-containing protein [Candidatus Jordarchaeum sp.]|uniref:roadblock/LC7 domain-containing protein n=1 Tax=Candidatus Jordarchaeum sp. TaxID=2823881 RepID=UPI00404A24A4